MASFDIVGNIAIFNKQISKKEANNILKQLKNIKTVAYKTDTHKGKYRLKKIKILAGRKTKETLYKENNVVIKLDVEKCYFSARLASERLRIAKQVKPGEEILCMFSGVAIYPLVIARNSLARTIYAVEINPIAHKYAQENLKLNKINNIILYKGDVKKVLPKMKKKFDRILMPLPKSSETFLDLAIKKIKKHGIIHFYTFAQEKEKAEVRNKIKKHIKNFKILKITKCGNYSPFTFRFCFDIKVL